MISYVQDALFVLALLSALVLVTVHAAARHRRPSAPLAVPKAEPAPPPAAPSSEPSWAWSPPSAPVHAPLPFRPRRLHGAPVVRDATDDERALRAQAAAREAALAAASELRVAAALRRRW